MACLGSASDQQRHGVGLGTKKAPPWRSFFIGLAPRRSAQFESEPQMGSIFVAAGPF